MARIVIQEGDISEAEVDAIVNAANTRLVLGSGVAGAIRSRGGPRIQAECDRHGPIGLGEVAVTGAGDLPARYVLHAAAMEPGGDVTEAALRSATRAALAEAERLGVRSVALPAIGTGVGGFPLQRCAEVMFEEVHAHPSPSDAALEEIRFVLYGEPAYRLFEQVHDAERIKAQMARLGRSGGSR